MRQAPLRQGETTLGKQLPDEGEARRQLMRIFRAELMQSEDMAELYAERVMQICNGRPA